MLPLIALLLTTSPTANTKVTAAVCDIGRLALRDLPAIDHNRGYARYYGNADLKSEDLIAACPALRAEIPQAFPLADDLAIDRASVHGPTQGQITPLTMVFEIGAPEISADLKTATVEMGYICTGLCGAGFVAHYVNGPGGWRRDGEIRNTYVS